MKIGMCCACGDGYARKTIIWEDVEYCLPCAAMLGLDADDDQDTDTDDDDADDDIEP